MEKNKNIDKEIHKYSDFPVWDILYTLSSFLSYVEGEKYVPHIISYLDPTVIVKESLINNEKLDKDSISKLYDNGDLVMFNNHSYIRLDFYDKNNEVNYMVGNFDYLNNFIHGLIQYRIDNNKKEDMSFEKDLYKYIIDYLNNNPDLVKRNSEKRNDMLKNEFWSNTRQKVFNKNKI